MWDLSLSKQTQENQLSPPTLKPTLLLPEPARDVAVTPPVFIYTQSEGLHSHWLPVLRLRLQEVLALESSARSRTVAFLFLVLPAQQLWDAPLCTLWLFIFHCICL